MKRAALAAAALLVAAAGASPPRSSASAPEVCSAAPPALFPGFGGSVDVMVAGERRPRCSLLLRPAHGPRGVAAGPDGLLYVAEDSDGRDDGANERRDGGVVDVFRADGTLVRVLTDGIVGPTGLAVDGRNRLFVLNSGSFIDRGKASGVRASIAIFEPRATSPSRTIVLPAGEKPAALALTRDGDAIVGDSLEENVPDRTDGRISRYRASDGKRMWSVGVPHVSLRTPTVITGMPLDDLRVLDMRAVVALYGSDSSDAEEPFFVELAQADGRVLRKVAVPKAYGLAVGRGGSVFIATRSAVLAFAPGVDAGERIAWPAADVVIATSREGALWYESNTTIRG